MDQGATFPAARTKTSCRVKCAVKGCSSKLSDLNIIFHKFPKPQQRFVSMKSCFNEVEKVDQFKAWKIKLKLNNINSYVRVCSLHFKKDDYIFPDAASKRKILNKNAIPSLNLPEKCNTKINAEKNLARLKRLEKRCEKKIREQLNEAESENNSADLCNYINETANLINLNQTEEAMKIDMSENNMLCEVNSNIITKETVPIKKFASDAAIQVNTIFEKPKFISLLQFDSDLSSFTGIENFAILDTIVELVKSVKGNKFDNSIHMNAKDRIVLTYTKLKLNLTYKCLSVLFNCFSAKHCQRIFHDTIILLNECLTVAIAWPSKKEILQNLPKCFEGLENVRIILDCTEIFIQRPANLCCQILTYSNYKGGETLKFMTGVTPAGNISFVSKAYGGRVSDSCIFSQSNLTSLLEPGDAIIVDKGFLIDEICEKNQWKCIRPPFLKEKIQLSKSEAILSRKIAAARVHIERSNQRIKNFKILSSKMTTTVLPIAEEIFRTVCATVNLSSPILKDNKFMEV